MGGSGGWSRAEHRIHSLGPSWPPPDEGEAGMPTTRRLAQGRWLGAGPGHPSGRTPLSGSRRLVVTFGSFALHGPPPREEGGKHQGPETRPKVKERRGERPPPPSVTAAAGMGSQHQQPFLRWWWAAEGDSSALPPWSPPPSDAKSVSPLSPGPSARGPGVHFSISAPRGYAGAGSGVAALARPWVGQGCSPVCYMVQKKSPALARASGVGRVLPPWVPDVHRAGTGT